MANLTFERRRKLQIYLLAALIAICCLALVACNTDTSYSVEGDLHKPTHFMAKFMLIINNSIAGGTASFGWTVVVFTIVLRLILSPLDIWQKLIGRKNAKIMERIKPQLEALQEKYAEDKQRLQQEQAALYKKEKYSMTGMCLPTIITLVVFFIVFAGFRQMVGYQFAKDYKECRNAYDAAFSEQIKEQIGKQGADESEWVVKDNGDDVFDLDDIIKNEKGAEFKKQAVEAAQEAVAKKYKDTQGIRSWLWIKNIFVGDTWAKAVPDFATVTGQSGMANSRLAGLTVDEYNLVMAKVIGTGGYGKGGSWNGLLILPVLSIALSFLSQKLASKSQGQPPQAKDGAAAAVASQQSTKMMQWLMPLMMGAFALMYSGAFALYMFTSSLTAILFQLLFNVCGKIADKVAENKANPRIAKR